MRVDVFSDVVCPWCRAGEVRFAEALARLGWDDEVEVVHRPFELPVKPGSPPRPSTFDAHRRLEWARATEGWPTQRALAERLLRAWHDDGADVGDHAVLAGLAAEVGLDEGLAADVLASEAYGDEVRSSEAEAVEREIFAVPTFVVDGGFAIPGAQDVDTFVNLLTRIARRA